VALLCLLVGGTASTALAEAEEPREGAGAAAPATEFDLGRGLAIIGVCFGAGMIVIGGGFGIARIGRSCMESIARQPEAGTQMFGPMVVAAAMVEGGMLFGIVVCLLGILKL